MSTLHEDAGETPAHPGLHRPASRLSAQSSVNIFVTTTPTFLLTEQQATGEHRTNDGF